MTVSKLKKNENLFQNLKKNENFEKSVENTGIEQHFIHLVNKPFDSKV